MKNLTFRQQVNNISSYSQINKSFRHVHGIKAAAVLSTLLYKYDYWEREKGLKPITTRNGNTLWYFHISKLDLAIDSGVSISALDKNLEIDPLTKLEELKMIKRIKVKGYNKSDRFILYQNSIINEVKKAKNLFDEDMAMIKELPRQHQRTFYKALNGKQDRKEVYKKFKAYIEYEEIDDVDCPSLEETSTPNEENSAPIEAVISPDEGRTKNNTKNIQENQPKMTNTRFSNEDLEFKLNDNDLKFEKLAKDKKITPENLKNVIIDYVEGNISEWHVHTILKNYIPDNAGSKWEMSPEDKEYIKVNLDSRDLGNLYGSLEYIETNIQSMISGKRTMRFGSILAGIREKVLEAGIDYEEPYVSRKEYQESLDATVEEESFDFEDQL